MGAYAAKTASPTRSYVGVHHSLTIPPNSYVRSWGKRVHRGMVALYSDRDGANLDNDVDRFGKEIATIRLRLFRPPPFFT